MKFQGLRLLPIFVTVTLLFAFSLVFPTQMSARSGCCSHHGGVCGCSCCDGTPLSNTCAPYYPQCSQPVYVAPIKTIIPIIYTPKPTIKIVATVKPTVIPTSTKTPIPTPTPTPTRPPEVKAVSTEATPTDTASPKSNSSGGGIFGWIVLGGVAVGLLKIFGKKKKKEEIPPRV